MFKRVILENWADLIPMLSFGIMFTVFVVTTVRAICIRPKERERLSNLPLNDTNEPSDP